MVGIIQGIKNLLSKGDIINGFEYFKYSSI